MSNIEVARKLAINRYYREFLGRGSDSGGPEISRDGGKIYCCNTLRIIYTEDTKTKNKEPKVIPMNQTALGMLRKKNGVVSISGYVFSTRNGKTISRWNLKREFNKAVKKAGIERFRFHDLRHTFATQLVQSGIDLYRVAKLLVHRDISSTQRYAHHCPDSLCSSVEVLDKCNKSDTIDTAQRDGIKKSL